MTQCSVLFKQKSVAVEWASITHGDGLCTMVNVNKRQRCVGVKGGNGSMAVGSDQWFSCQTVG